MTIISKPLGKKWKNNELLKAMILIKINYQAAENKMCWAAGVSWHGGPDKPEQNRKYEFNRYRK